MSARLGALPRSPRRAAGREDYQGNPDDDAARGGRPEPFHGTPPYATAATALDSARRYPDTVAAKEFVAFAANTCANHAQDHHR